MSGKLEVIKATHNRISVKWCLKRQSSIEDIIFSPPFALINDSSPICFFLSIHDKKLWIDVNLGCSTHSRAVVKLAVSTTAGDAKIRRGFMPSLGHVSFSDIIMQFHNTMTINCEITWFGYLTKQNKSPYDLPEVLSKESFLHDAEENPDFYIIIENQKLSTRRAVLASHSPVLAAMFKTPMRESKENEMIIEDVEYCTMRIILQMIYTDTTDDLNDIDTALKVLQVSEKYQMEKIKGVCERKLQVRINDHNVLKLLDEADTYNASELCYSCIEYIVARNEEIISYKKFDKLIAERPTMVLPAYKVMCSFGRDTSVPTISAVNVKPLMLAKK